jgi:hypothetical protein
MVWPKKKTYDPGAIMDSFGGKGQASSNSNQSGVVDNSVFEGLTKKQDDLEKQLTEFQTSIKQNQALMSNMMKMMKVIAQGGIRKEEPEQEPDPLAINLNEDELENLDPKKVLALTLNALRKGFEAHSKSIDDKLNGLKTQANQQYGNSEANRLAMLYPDFHEWTPEMETYIGKLGNGFRMSGDDIYQAVRAMHPEKAQQMDKKYRNSGAGTSSLFRFGNAPDQDSEQPSFTIETYDDTKGVSVEDDIANTLQGYMKFVGHDGSLKELIDKEDDDLF